MSRAPQAGGGGGRCCARANLLPTIELKWAASHIRELLSLAHTHKKAPRTATHPRVRAMRAAAMRAAALARRRRHPRLGPSFSRTAASGGAATGGSPAGGGGPGDEDPDRPCTPWVRTVVSGVDLMRNPK